MSRMTNRVAKKETDADAVCRPATIRYSVWEYSSHVEFVPFSDIFDTAIN